MHRNTPVAEIKIIDNIPICYEDVFCEAELPKGTKNTNKITEQLLLKAWYESRSIPKERPNLSTLISKLGVNRAEAFIKSSGVSLTDTYWIKEKEDVILWEDINYYDNGFSEVLKDLYCFQKGTFKPSPDFTTGGVMEKFWMSVFQEPYLLKMDKNNSVFSANEVVYFKIAESIGIQTTPYFYGNLLNIPVCICPSFVPDSKTDFVTALQEKHANFRNTGELFLKHFFKLGFEKEIKEMITLDCLLHNTDRHEKNFGYLLFSNGEKRFAPLFDNGRCLGADRLPNSSILEDPLKPFNKDRDYLIKNYGVSIDAEESFWIDIIKSTYEDFQVPEYQYEIAKEELKYGLSFSSQIEKLFFYEK